MTSDSFARVERLETWAVSVPLERPVAAAVLRMDHAILVLARLTTVDGLTGTAYVLGFTPGGAQAVIALAHDLFPLVKGRSALAVEETWGRLWAAIPMLGRRGLAVYPLSLLDMCLWDILAKSRDLPLSRALGGERDRVPAYNSIGLWLDKTPDELAEEARAMVADGWTAVKARAGRPGGLRADMAAAWAVRQAIGPNTQLMVDSNQSLGVKQALQMAEALAPLELAWYEEPVPAEDLAGHATIRRAAAMPLATGETLFGLGGVRELLDVGGCDILMPDLQRIGGVTGWRKVAALAEASGIPVSPHIYPEFGVHLIAATPNATIQEWMPWAQPLYREHLRVEGGRIHVPNASGVGLEIDWERVERWRI